MEDKDNLNKKKRKIKKVDFSGDNSHICICSTPANGQEDITIMKSKGGSLGDKDNDVTKDVVQKAEEVRITTSMATFLETFFRMFHEDANELAEILGYEPTEWFFDMVGDDTIVEMLKSKEPDEVKDIVHDDFTVSKEVYEALKKVRPYFNKIKKNKEKEKTMADKDLEKRLEELEKSQKAKDEALEKANQELEKERQKRESLEKASLEKEKKEYEELFKGYSFVEETDVPCLVETAIKCKDIEGFHDVLKTLEKANTAMKSALEKEHGSDEDKDVTGESPNLSKVGELIKQRKEQ